MSTFAIPRSGSDLASVVLGGHDDVELSRQDSTSLMRRIRARIDLLAGSTADEQYREQLVQDLFTQMVYSSEAKSFPSLTEFEAYARRLVTKQFTS